MEPVNVKWVCNLLFVRSAVVGVILELEWLVCRRSNQYQTLYLVPALLMVRFNIYYIPLRLRLFSSFLALGPYCANICATTFSPTHRVMQSNSFYGSVSYLGLPSSFAFGLKKYALQVTVMLLALFQEQLCVLSNVYLFSSSFIANSNLRLPIKHLWSC
jgi:hypothetical protein